MYHYILVFLLLLPNLTQTLALSYSAWLHGSMVCPALDR